MGLFPYDPAETCHEPMPATLTKRPVVVDCTIVVIIVVVVVVVIISRLVWMID